MIDIVFPEGNEKEFIKHAQKLGITKLVFVYKKKEQLPQTTFPLVVAQLVKPPRIPREGITIVSGPEHARAALERGVSLLYDLEQEPRKDSLHYRQSGLHQVLCKLAAQKKTTIGFSFASLLKSSGAKRAQLLGRIQQNIRYCRKYKVAMKIASFATSPEQMRQASDLAALFEFLGMHPQEAKRALQHLP